MKRTLEPREYTWLVDGGYLVWKYAPQPLMGGWPLAKFGYTNCLVMLDHRSCYRQEVYFPAYKARRKQRNASDPERALKAEKARRLTSMIIEDPTVPSAYSPGCEADDLIALHYLLYPDQLEGILAVDKDYLQLPGIWKLLVREMPDVRTWEGPPWATLDRFPQYGGPVTCAKDFFLLQVLFGDSSDSVPRLLPKGWGLTTKALIQQIRECPWPLRQTYELFGERALLNIKLLAMPGVWLLKEPPPSPDHLIGMLEDGSYWSAESFLPPRLHR
jgi:hypothetical protein